MGDPLSVQGLMVRNGVVVTHERFQCISIANMAAALLSTFFIDWYLFCTGTLLP